MPQVSDLSASAQLIDLYVTRALRYARVSRSGKEEGNLEKQQVAMKISARYMNKVRLLQDSLA